MHEHPSWLVRVLDSRGGTAGTGVAVDGEHVVTCAHLAEARPGGGAALLLEPGREVVLHFPFLEREATATVVEGGWFPEQSDGSGDFAVLRLNDPPAGLAPAPLNRVPGPPGTAVEMRGFPDDQPVARTAKGRLSHPPRREWVQIDPEGDAGWAVERGFSGGPVWDVERKAVVGLTVAKDANRVGHMLSMRYLCELWPPLAERLTAAAPASEEDLSHWWPRARGLSGAHEQGWLFRGRRKALTEIVDWLREGRRHSVLVVTGTPGVGKSATLGRIVTTSHRPWAAMLPEDDAAVRAEPGSVDRAVHAKGKTALEVANEILAGCSGGAVERPEEFAGAIARAVGDDMQFNVVLDALDEAADDREARVIATRVLRPLSELPRARVVVGSRRGDGSGDLLAHFGDGLRRLDLDAPEYFEFQDLTDYAEAALRQASGDQAADPYADPAAAAAVAARIAALAEGNFLVAGLVARSRGRYDTAPVDPAELAFSSDVSVVFWEYLERLEPFDGIPAKDLLTALAFADAPGFTPELWAAALRALDDVTVSPKRLVRFAKSGAANFLIETGASDGRSFRIFHQALVDACLRRRAETEDRAESEAALTGEFIGIGSAESWEQAPPYLWRSLIGHATRGGAAEALLSEVEFLVVADPERVLPLLGGAAAGRSALLASIYRATSGHLHHAAFRERRALLSYNAARYGAGRIAAALAEPEHGEALEWRPLWATGSGIDPRLRLTIPVGANSVNEFACTVLDGATVAVTAGYDDRLSVWNLATGRLESRIELPQHTRVRTLAVASVADRPVAVLGCDDGIVKAVDLVGGGTLSTTAWHEGANIESVACTVVDGRAVAVAGDRYGTVRVTDLETGQQLGGDLQGHVGDVETIACIRAGDRPLAVTGGEDGLVRIWDLTAGRQDGELRQDTSSFLIGIDMLACDEIDGRPVVMAASGSGELRMWDLESRARIESPLDGKLEHSSVRAFARMPEGPTVITVAGDKRFQLWNLSTGREFGPVFRLPQTQVGEPVVTFIEDRPVIVTSGERGGVLHVWDPLADQEDGDRAVGHEGRIGSVATASGDGTVMVASTSGFDGIALREARSGDLVRSIEVKHRYSHIRGLACAETAEDLVAVAAEGTDLLRMWSMRSGAQLRPILTDNGSTTAVAYVPFDGRSVAVAPGDDRTLRSYDLETGRLVGAMDTGEGVGSEPFEAFAVDGEPYAAVFHFNGVFQAWSLRTGERTDRFRSERHDFSLKDFSCMNVDGRVVCAVALDRSVRILDLGTGAETATIPFPEPVSAVAFTEDGLLAVGSGQDVSVFVRMSKRRKHAA